MAVLPLLAPADAIVLAAGPVFRTPGATLLGLARRASPRCGPPARTSTRRRRAAPVLAGPGRQRCARAASPGSPTSRPAQASEGREAARTASELAPNSAAADETSAPAADAGRSDAIMTGRRERSSADRDRDLRGTGALGPRPVPEGQEFFATMIDEAREAMRRRGASASPGLRFRFARRRRQGSCGSCSSAPTAGSISAPTSWPARRPRRRGPRPGPTAAVRPWDDSPGTGSARPDRRACRRQRCPGIWT
jgi:hypothetical protein